MYKIRAEKTKEAPSEIVLQSEAWIDQLQDHPRWIWGGAAVLVALIAGTIAVAYFDRQAEERAWTLESAAAHLFHDPPPPPQPKEAGKPAPTEITDKTERFKESARLYEDLLKKYPATDSAPMAMETLGHVYYELKEYDKAEAQYRAFLAKYSDRKDDVAALQTKLGYLHQAKGDDAAALTAFRTAYEMAETKTQDQAGFELGRLLERMEKKTEAADLYKQVSETYTESPWGTEAKVRLAILVPPTPTPTPPSGTTPPAGAAPPVDAAAGGPVPPTISVNMEGGGAAPPVVSVNIPSNAPPPAAPPPAAAKP